MPKVIWRIIPDNITLSDPDNWQRTVQDRYRATRYYIAIVEEKSFEAKSTPPLITVPVPAGVKPAFSEKKIVVVTYTESITDTIQHSVASKIAAESSLKSSASVKEGFSSELQTKISTEISTSLSSQLSSTKAYQVQSTHELLTSIAFEHPGNAGQAGKLIYYLYLPVWPVRWNVYLYRVESIELNYRRFSFNRGMLKFFKKVREARPLDTYEPKFPLAQLSFYEPQEVIAVHSGKYTPGVIYPDEVRAGLLAAPCGELPVPTPTMSLEDCAKVAFPETEEEIELRERAKRVSKERKKSPLTGEIERAELASKLVGQRRGGPKKGTAGGKVLAGKQASSVKSGSKYRTKSTGKAKRGKKQTPSLKKGRARKARGVSRRR
ncbi:MAG: hypothetical protein QOJ02_3222 [Acidobacteriota bacterium]|jgi:hypothetical protein|nr:hypothetical protein [Acidobacteriota bacterium]